VVPVQVAVADLGTAARSVAATGTVEPIRTVGVVSQVGGALRAVTAEEGDVVRAGAVLARIDAPELDAQLVSANAALEAARATAQRSAQLFAGRIVTAAENERDQAALAAAQATRDQLRTRLGFATVRAPIDGVVFERTVRAGDIAAPQLRLFTIADVSTLVVRVPVSELNVTALHASDPVTVALDALPERTLEGRIRRVFPSADSVTRLVPVEVALTGAAARAARPGFLARVTFRLEPRTGVLMVPGTAVLENPRGAVVYVVKDGRGTLRPVTRGATYQGRVEITNGLEPGDSVVVAGNTMLRDGAAVRVVERVQPDTPRRDTTATTVGVR
jgi:RND family efflux transporter MFP subunit